MKLVDKLYNIMKDKEEHSNIELSNLIGWRFCGYIYQLKKKWYVFEKTSKKKGDKAYTEYFRLLNPNLEITIVKNGKATQKFLKLHEDFFLGDTNIPNTNLKKKSFLERLL